MPITIGSNLASLTAQRRLSENTSQLSKTYERLSSGQRINRAADDAAGLAISESLKSDRRVFNQGVRNFNDGISLLNIADGAIENLSNIVIRLKELAEQSANGTYSTTQRAAIDKEAQALSKEFTRIAQSTKFNGIQLLDGSLGNGVRLQGGFGTDGSIFSGIGGAKGTGTYTQSSTIANTSINEMILGDLNGDGFQDIVKVVAGGNIRIQLGDGTGNFGAETNFSSGLSSVSALSLGDANNDGALDIAAAGNLGGSGSVAVILGNANGTFRPSSTYSVTGISATDAQLFDINNDGNMDLVASSAGGIASVRIGAGNGTFGSNTNYTMTNNTAYAVTMGDLNSDGILDLVAAGGGFSNGEAIVRLGTGNGTFGSAATYATESLYSRKVELGDLNGDGKLDLITAGYDGLPSSTTIRLGRGDGTFGSATSYVAELAEVFSLSLGDLNGDGILDIFTAGYAGGAAGSTTIRLGNGDGTFGAGKTNTYSTAFVVGAIGDTNSDGVQDLVVGGSGGSNLTFSYLANTKEGVHSLLSFNLSTMADARQALPVFDQKIQQLAKQRGQIGAFQSRVQVGINTLQSSSENYAAAESRIRDADIADESSKLLRLNILQKAASSVLGQANLQPSLALSLLK